MFTSDLADCETAGQVTVENPECLDYAQRVASLNAVHGTIVAETLMDIAPEASLYVANPKSKADLQAAADWMASEGVSVINHSVGWTFDGPGDGSSPLSVSPLNTVDRAVARDILWVNSAGNHAEGTWFRGYSDPDGDKIIRFGGSNDEVAAMPLRACRGYTVQLRWEDDWDGASKDLDLYLYKTDTREYVFSSEVTQSGESRHAPLEWLSFWSGIDSDAFGIVIHHHGGSVPDWIQLVVWGVDPIQHHTRNGSIGNPAESANPGMLAVGAAPWYDVHAIEPFSSRGTTPDGRVKPDIVGADCGEVALLEARSRGGSQCWFPGTSQAAPHVAGLGALVKQRFPDFSPEEVADYLKDSAQQRQSPDPNDIWGYGFAVLPPIGGCSDNPGLAADCDMLLAARDTLAGTGTLNWSADVPITTWDGVTVGGSPLRATKLQLSDKGLTGELPSELGSLANLEELYLWGNELTGAIPAELGSLANLKELSLTRNQLSGEIPPELAGLTSLEILALGGNQLTGTVPAWLGSLGNLEGLYLWGNGLTGTIPVELGSLGNLKELWLSENQLTGEIPAELGSLSSLKELDIGGNQLGDEIPAEMGSLSTLTWLSLANNKLGGEIPPELGNLSSLEYLHLWGNQFTGEIPSELGSLSELTRLSLVDNELSGEIPAELGNLANLELLRLWGNQLTGGDTRRTRKPLLPEGAGHR